LCCPEGDAAGRSRLITRAPMSDIIVADRLTEGPGEIFPSRCQRQRAFVAAAVNIRHSESKLRPRRDGVTRAGPASCNPLRTARSAFMVDLSRGVSRATADYHSSGNQSS